MTLTTDNSHTSTTLADAERPAPSRSIRPAVGWVAVAAAATATVAFAVSAFSDSGSESPARTQVVALQDVAGSDRHLELRAAEIAGRTDGQRSAAAGSDRHLELRAAEIAKGQEIAP